VAAAEDSKVDSVTSPYAPDVDAVRVWLEDMVRAMSFGKLIAAILTLITRMRDLNTELTKRVAHLTRKRPRSETLERLERQLPLKFEKDAETAATPAPELVPAPEKKPPRSRRGRHPGRGALAAHLPRVPDVSRVTPERRICPLCGLEMPTMGFSEHDVLDVRPAEFFVRACQVERCACPHCDHIVSAKAPAQLVPGGKLGDTLIVEALCDKFVEHQPIERQCLRFARAGVEIAPQTLGRSVAVAIDRLAPLAALIEGQTRAPGLLGTDATSIPVLDRDAPEGIRMGTIWAWTNARWITFFYSPSGDSDSVRRFLGDDLCRTVQCDGTNIMTFLERAGGKRPGCWAHGRRRLVEAARSGDALGLEGVKLIAPLFAIERASMLAGDTAEQRAARRRRDSAPVLDALRLWLDEQRGKIPPKTPLGKALGYLHRQWKRLTLFLDDGHIELTNNRRERELRKLVLGRRNWLFTWKDLGGERTARILSIVATAVAHGLNPRAYLHAVVRLLVEGWPVERLRELLPDRIAVLRPELSVEVAADTEPPLLLARTT
jgi:transposase